MCRTTCKLPVDRTGTPEWIFAREALWLLSKAFKMVTWLGRLLENRGEPAGFPDFPFSGIPVAVYIFTEKATCDGLIDKPTLIFTNLTKWCSVHNATCNPHRRRLCSGCIMWTLIRAFKRYYLTNYILI